MKRLCRLFGLEMVGAIKWFAISCLAIAIASGIMLVCLLGLLSINKNQENDSFVTLGVVLENQDDIFGTLIKYSNNISSLKGICRLEIFEKEEAMSLLQDNEIQMVMVIPEDFMSLANSMQETQFTVYIPKDVTASQLKIISLLHGVEELMVTTEGAILTMYDGIDEYHFDVTKSQMEEDMMRLYVSQFLNRDMYFDVNYVSVYGNMRPVQFYMSVAVVLSVIIGGSFFFNMYDKGKLLVERLICTGKMPRYQTSIIKPIVIAAFLWIPTQIIIRLLIYSDTLIGEYHVVESSLIGATAFCLTLGIASIIQILSAVVVYRQQFIYYLAMIFMVLTSGLIGSRYYLPIWARSVARFVPTGIWHASVTASMWGAQADLVVASICTALLYLTGVILYIRRLSQYE